MAFKINSTSVVSDTPTISWNSVTDFPVNFIRNVSISGSGTSQIRIFYDSGSATLYFVRL